MAATGSQLSNPPHGNILQISTAHNSNRVRCKDHVAVNVRSATDVNELTACSQLIPIRRRAKSGLEFFMTMPPKAPRLTEQHRSKFDIPALVIDTQLLPERISEPRWVVLSYRDRGQRDR